MTDDELQAEMERGPARRAALDARVRSALLALAHGDNASYLTQLGYLLNDTDRLQLAISYGRVYITDLTGCQGTELTRRRLEADISLGREIVLEEEL